MLSFFFFNDTATTEIYTLSLHDALPISVRHIRALRSIKRVRRAGRKIARDIGGKSMDYEWRRSEEHTSELQSQSNLVCRLLLEKKKKTTTQASKHTMSESYALCSSE